MSKIFTAPCDFLFWPFYGFLCGFPFGMKVGRHPFYIQMQYLHFRLTRCYRKGDIPRTVKPLPGCDYSMYLSPGADFLQHHLYIAGAYEADLTQRIAAELKTCDAFVDVGAHIGYYSLLAKKVNNSMRVYAFEPQLSLFETLKKNSEVNHAGVEAFCFALGSENGILMLHTSRFPEQASLLGTNLDNLHHTEVVVKRGDDILAEKKRLICIKIDTEGYEFEVLDGMQQLMCENHCTVFIEYHSRQYEEYFWKEYAAQKLEKWKTAGYEVLYATGKRVGQQFCPDRNIKDRPVLLMRRAI